MAHPAIKPGFSLSVGSSVGLAPSSQWPRYLLQNLYRSGMVLIVAKKFAFCKEVCSFLKKWQKQGLTPSPERPWRQATGVKKPPSKRFCVG